MTGVPIACYARVMDKLPEWQTRVDLAACYRLCALYGWADGIYTHISAAVPGEPGHYLINAFGLCFDEVTASNLVKVDSAGNVIGALPAPVNQSGFRLLFPDNEHVRNLFHFRITDFPVNLFVPQINRAANIGIIERFQNFFCIIFILLGDGKKDELPGTEPQWKVPGAMLDEHRHETFQRPERRTMDHYRAMFLVITSSIFQFKTLWQIIIHLYSSQLPFASQGVFHHKIKLRPVKSSLAQLYYGA